MDPHDSASDDEEDEDFVLPEGGNSDDGDDEGESGDDVGDSKRKLDDVDDGKPAKKKQKKQTNLNIKSTTTQPTSSVDTEKKITDIWEEMKKQKDSKPADIPSSSSSSSSSSSLSSSTSSTTPSTTATTTVATATTTPTTTSSTPTTTSTLSTTTNKSTTSTPSSSVQNKSPAPKQSTFTFAGEKVAVPRAPQRGGSALDNLVAGMGKKSKLSVLDKSKLDWNQFKTNTGTTDELAHHKKNGYLEKVAFLQRTDERRFELEKKQRQVVRDVNAKK